MTINAAMPAVPQNMSYSGTAAATDNSTASDFSGALGNMMNAKGTIATQNTVAGESEMTAVQQESATGEAVMTAEQTMAMNQLHKELMMKNAGYANSELIAMLLKGSDAELTQLMDFGGEIPEGIVAQTETVTAVTEGVVTEQLLPETNTLSEDAETVQTDFAQFIPDVAEKTVNTTETAEIPVQTADTEPSDKADPEVTAAEDTVKLTFATATEEILPADMKTADSMPTDTEATDVMAKEPEADVNTVQVQTQSTETVNLENTVKTVTADSKSDMASAEDGTDTAITQTETVSAQGQSKAAEQTDSKADAKPEAMTNAMQSTKVEMTKAENITIKSDMTQQTQEATKQTQEATKQTQEATKQIQEVAEQTPEAVEETPDFEVSLARAGRKISEKSEEALQLAKSISGTKSDSDLETEQKVTVKQELTDGGVMRNDLQPDNSVRDDVRAERPVRLTVNEAYQIINERASSGEKQTFTVELTPETLGKITVKMTSENGKLSVEILTETEAAKQLFEARANELANNLRQNDVEIGSYRVETENEQLFNESFDGSSKNPYAEKQQSESSDDEDEFERLISEMMGM